MPHREVLAVVGNGMAGHRLCERLVELDVPRHVRIVVFGAESRPAYDRVHLGDVLRGSDVEALTLADESWYASHGIELHLKDPIESLDLRRRIASSARGWSHGFDRLVLATGSEAFLPPIEGLSAPGVFVYRTADDAAAIRAAAVHTASRGGAVGVLGGGLLGLEVACLLQRLGCKVVVLERAPHLLSRQLPAAAARHLETRLTAHGVELQLATTLRRVAASSDGLELDLADRRSSVDLLVVAVGVRPNDGLARRAGLACHPDGGIRVDDALRTSDPAVFAVGECVRHRGVVAGLAAPALATADVLAERIAGTSRVYTGCVPATRLKVEDVELTVIGDTLADGRGVDLLRHESGSTQRCLVVAGGRAIGAVAIGAAPDWPRIQAAVESRARLGPFARQRFLRTGSPWRVGWGASPQAVASWPDARILCTCARVSCGAVRQALASGSRTAQEVSERTRAGTLCGSCRPLLDQLAGATAPTRPARVPVPLVAAAVVAIGLGLVLALAPPTSVPTSVRSERPIDALWSSSLVRQATGFFALGLCVASLGLSLRKRWARLRDGSFGSFGAWRALHAVLGATALAALVAHTGLRSGGRLDQWLLASLLAASLAGALAGLAAGFETWLPAGGPLRRAANRMHLLVLIPFPALVFFHVLKVYWF